MAEVGLVADLNAQGDGGQVPFAVLPSSVAKTRHLMGPTIA